jgi:hypothetical protein
MGLRLAILASVSIVALLPACRSTSRAPDAGTEAGAAAKPSQFINAPAELGVAVIVSNSSLIVDEEVVLPVPPPQEAAATGFASKNKATSPDGTIVVPLAEAVRKDREKQKAEGRTYDKAFIVADSSTPYRILTEVLTTLKSERITS